MPEEGKNRLKPILINYVFQNQRSDNTFITNSEIKPNLSLDFGFILSSYRGWKDQKEALK